MNSQQGFTLIELLVVATIIVVLSAIGIVSYINSGQSARDSRRKADLENVRQAMILYRSENGDYVPSGGSQSQGNYSTIVNALDDDHLSQPTPIDPRNQGDYFYSAESTDSSFCICANLETENGNSGSRSCSSLGSTGGYYCVGNP